MSIVPLHQETFDYNTIDRPVADQLRIYVQEIHQYGFSVAQSMTEIGRRFEWAHQRLQADKWRSWLMREFALSPHAAASYIRIYQIFGNIDWSTARVEPKALKILSSVFVQPELQEAAKRIVEIGQPLTIKTAQQLVARNDVPIRRGPGRPQTSRLRRAAEKAGLNVSHGHPEVSPQVMYDPTKEQHVILLDTLHKAVANLQVALATSYGVPLAGPVRRALAHLQTLVPHYTGHQMDEGVLLVKHDPTTPETHQ